MIKTCTYPECENLCEGRTDFCATHGRIMRKQSQGIQQIEVKAASEQKGLSLYVAKKKAFAQRKVCELKGVHFECSGKRDIHHRKGREGDLLLDTNHWMVVCRRHHDYIHLHPEEAYANGWSELRLANEPHEI